MPRPKSNNPARRRSVRLTDAQWEELLKRGGADYLRFLLDLNKTGQFTKSEFKPDMKI